MKLIEYLIKKSESYKKLEKKVNEFRYKIDRLEKDQKWLNKKAIECHSLAAIPDGLFDKEIESPNIIWIDDKVWFDKSKLKKTDFSGWLCEYSLTDKGTLIVSGTNPFSACNNMSEIWYRLPSNKELDSYEKHLASKKKTIKPNKKFEI